MKRTTLFLFLAMMAVGCSSGSDSKSSSSSPLPSTSANVKEVILKAQAATEAMATNPNGLSYGSGFTVSNLNGFVSPFATNFDPNTHCTNSGGPASPYDTEQASGYPMAFLMCSVLKQPDGPDTVRGGFDRIMGLLCALGDLTYDGVQRVVNITIDSTCFSAAFIEAACGQGNNSCQADVNVTASNNNSSISPASFQKLVKLDFPKPDNPNETIKYTIAYKSSATELAGALMAGHPGDSDVGETFAFHLSTATGKLRYEGRFSSDVTKRHIRIEANGNFDSSMAVTDVNQLSFVQSEYYSQGTVGRYVSIHGNREQGRKIISKGSADITALPPDFDDNADDGDCYGDAVPTCNGNEGILHSDMKFFFVGNNFTPGETWFKENSYLGSVSGAVNMNDLWQ